MSDRTDVRRSIEERFWAKVEKTETCWLWTGAVTRDGYGKLGRGRRGEGQVMAHRLAHELLIGTILPGLSVDHKCHVPRCVNPAHLQAVLPHLNSQNRQGAQANNALGVRGVYWESRARRFVVDVRVRGKRYGGGYHRTLADAEAAAIALRNRVMTNNLADRT